jgi:hypothetical protein
MKASSGILPGGSRAASRSSSLGKDADEEGPKAGAEDKEGVASRIEGGD